jgi:hypothetical protein
VHVLIALVPILLAALGGSSALTLTVPVTALLTVKSASAAGAILAGMSTAQKIEAVNLLLQRAPHIIKVLKRVDPVIGQIVDDIRARRLSAPQYNGKIVAVVHGGPGGWGRAPVTFVYQPIGQ